MIDGTHRSEADIKLLRQLLAQVDLSPDLADAVVDWIDGDDDLSGTSGAESAYYLSLPRPYRAANAPMVQVDELYRVRGFDSAAVARLRPYVTALRERTAINVNTASDTVIAAALGTTRVRAARPARRAQHEALRRQGDVHRARRGGGLHPGGRPRREERLVLGAGPGRPGRRAARDRGPGQARPGGPWHRCRRLAPPTVLTHEAARLPSRIRPSRKHRAFRLEALRRAQRAAARGRLAARRGAAGRRRSRPWCRPSACSSRA